MSSSYDLGTGDNGTGDNGCLALYNCACVIRKQPERSE